MYKSVTAVALLWCGIYYDLHIENREEMDMSNWISVEERLPEIRDDSVIAHWANGAVEMVHIEDSFADITDGFDDEGNIKYTQWYKTQNITHWMELPESPKETK